MDLRTRAGKTQRLQETIIRFRIPILIVLMIPWWIFASAWRDVVGALLAQAERNAMVMSTLMTGSIGNPMDWIRFGTGLLLLALLRWRVLGLRSMLSLLLSWLVVVGVCWALDGSSEVLPAILGLVLVGIVTLFFFAKNAWGIGILAFSLIVYGVAGWVSGIIHGQLGIGWQVLVGIAIADMLGQIALIRSHLKAGHAKMAGIVKAGQMAIVGSLTAWLVLLAMDLCCVFIGVPTLIGGGLLYSQLSTMGYFIGVAILGPILLSFSPFGRIQAKSRTLAKS